jgi:hypothetical protein
LDLDDLGGEMVLIDWGHGPSSYSAEIASYPTHSMMSGKVSLTIIQESGTKHTDFKKRLVRLHQNPLIKPLPDAVEDAVAQDVADIPQVLSDIITSWDSGTSINNISSWWLGRCISERLHRSILHYRRSLLQYSRSLLHCSRSFAL